MKEKAIEKLKNELKEAKDKTFAKPVITHLIEKCQVDEKLAEAVMKEKKTWGKCFSYLLEKAKKTAEKGARGAAIWHETVYAWAEEYFHSVDVEQPKKEIKPITPTFKPAPVIPTKAETPKVIEMPKKKGDVEGQLDMFALLGM